MMMGYDVALGTVYSNGSAYLKDYLTVGRMLPRLDTQQDWMLTNSSEENGITTLKFYRMRNTTDQQNDTAIPIGMYVPVVWAYHPSSDQLQHHGADYRGFMNVTLIPAMTMMTTTPTPTTAAPMTSSVVMPVSNSQQETVVPSIAPTATATTPTPAPMTSSVVMPVSNSQQETVVTSIAPTATATTPTPATASVVMPMPPPMHFSNFRSLNDGKYNVSWMYNSSMDTIHIMLEVRATGYIAFGLATIAPNNMTGYDAAIGKVESGTGDLKDYITVGRTQPRLDTNQDWTLTYSKEENGVTTLKFYRKRDTNDSQDIAIPLGTPIFLIWAYHPTNDTLQHHGVPNKGIQQITLIPAITPTTMVAPTPTTATASVVMPPPVNIPNFRSLNAGKYNVSWMYNSSMDTIHIMLEVRATGYIAFGLATAAPTDMVGYDAAIGKVESGIGDLKDYITVGRTQPNLDTNQDWTLTYSKEENGVTTLKFYRKRDTNDSQDIAIPLGTPIFLIWAYHPTSDTLQHHGVPNKGIEQITLIPAITPTTMMMTTMIAPTPTTATASVVMPMPPPVNIPNFRSLNDGKYNVSWMYNSSMDTIHIMLEVRATGYVAFGLATVAPNTMNGYDAAIGKVESGTGDLKDYITVGRTLPNLDTNQDWTLTYSKEENGVTTLKFYRKRDTNDSQDIAIPLGTPIFLIWAYHPTSDTLQHHGVPNKGIEQITLIPAITPTTAMMTTMAASTPTTEMTKFTHAFDNGRFRLLWTFDDQTDMVTFHVKVQTTGWVAFGFALTAPNFMMNYDVVVAGYSNGQGYLNDYYTEGRGRPLPDSKKDYELLSASEVGGYTELMFKRPRDTEDSKDVQFGTGTQVHLIWAYGTNDIRNDRDFDQHAARGFSADKVVIVGKQPNPTQPAAASSLHSCLYGSVTLAIVFFNVLSM
ncbi:DBH-like monooxygenase protein 1 [Desmophyllum pertusum]|uniref:DBH-like monooxygenase protein 1 n=1 Tax=Desmophyllum pertusum TaxID=174260 RepID=A0A9W9YCJ0_9CNID|nr:DBH-like monooxygenase protein 1 [Desmophyllum pertusum]